MDFSKLKLKPHKLFNHLDQVNKWKNGEDFVPVYVEINPTDRCNQKCVFCYTQYLGHTQLTIPDHILIRIFEDMGRAGVKSVLIQGTGEPLLHPALPEAIKAGKKSGLDVALCCNGSLIDETLPEEVINMLDFLRVSAFESTEILYAKTHGVKTDHWKKVVKGLEKVVLARESAGNRNLLIQATFLPLPHNMHSITDTVRMLKSIGVDFVMIKPPQHSFHNPYLNWDRESYAAHRIQFKEAVALSDESFIVHARWDMADIEVKHQAFNKNYKCCYGVEFEVVVDANAKIYPCFQYWRDDKFCLGDLNQGSFKEIWESEDRKRTLEHFYLKANLEECHCQCKQHHINEPLWEIKHPPLHVNFL